MVARRLCTTYVNPKLIAPFVACRLIALDKNPGVRPIGIGDTARRIIAKAVLSIVGADIQEAFSSVEGRFPVLKPLYMQQEHLSNQTKMKVYF